MDNHPMSDLMSITMEKIKQMVDVNTIVGSPIQTPDGSTIIPISKVSFGFASGGSDFGKREGSDPLKFGGGSGAGVNIVPIAFLVLSGGSVKMLPVPQPASTSVDRVVELVPELIDKVDGLIHREKKEEGGSR